MEEKYSLYYQKLVGAGLSNTKPRKSVFEALLKLKHAPVTIAELIELTRETADRATVYRTIDSLEKANIIKRIYTGWKFSLELNDDFGDHHHHITCIKCGVIHATHDHAALERELNLLAQGCGYAMTDHQLDIRGICKKCQLA